jgi:hypothetical protein
VTWWIDSDLWSSWQDEDEATWASNAQHLDPYRLVDGVTPTAVMWRCYVETGSFPDEPEPTREDGQQRPDNRDSER